MNAIGVVELISIARGYAAADAMLKAANVQLHAAKPVCPGKYAILVYGGVADVQSAGDIGRRQLDGEGRGLGQHVRLEITCGFPLRVPAAFDIGGFKALGEFHGGLGSENR